MVMEIKTCTKCGVEKPLTDFYKHPKTLDGRAGLCKLCHKNKVRENRAINSDYYRAYDAKRFKEDPRVRARHRRYQTTPSGKAAMARSRERWSLSHPVERAAHTILRKAVKSGKVKKPNVCSKCGAGGRIEGHHHDYTRPIDVTWLCRQCHVDAHRQLEKGDSDVAGN